jgi:hypothetical protein
MTKVKRIITKEEIERNGLIISQKEIEEGLVKIEDKKLAREIGKILGLKELHTIYFEVNNDDIKCRMKGYVENLVDDYFHVIFSCKYKEPFIWHPHSHDWLLYALGYYGNNVFPCFEIKAKKRRRKYANINETNRFKLSLYTDKKGKFFLVLESFANLKIIKKEITNMKMHEEINLRVPGKDFTLQLNIKLEDYENYDDNGNYNEED